MRAVWEDDEDALPSYRLRWHDVLAVAVIVGVIAVVWILGTLS